MRFVIVTGMSGAGKTTALKILEDIGYFCVDNIPVPLIDKFVQLLLGGQSGKYDKAALGVDVRSGESFGAIREVLEGFRIPYEILFLEAEDEVLVKRYKETRRAHPLARDGRIGSGVSEERRLLTFLKTRADCLIDTSHMLTRELRQKLEQTFREEKKEHQMVLTILSFGFKNGVPRDADLVFDVRFLPNPYYVETLRRQTGMDEAVYRYVMESDLSGRFLEKLEDMLAFLIPLYIEEGRQQLVIAVGCTGGCHRSVAVARRLFEDLQKQEAVRVYLEHRDIQI